MLKIQDRDLVQKYSSYSKTTTNVIELNEDERIEEIARMLSGSTITSEAREAASKLLINKKNKYKNFKKIKFFFRKDRIS